MRSRSPNFPASILGRLALLSAGSLGVLGLLVLLGLAGAKAATPAPEENRDRPASAEVRFDVSLNHYRAAEYRKALLLVSMIERDSPGQVRFGDENLHNFKGSCLTALRYFQHARKAFEKALATQPESFDMKYNLAEMDFLQEHFASARVKFTKLQETDRGRLYSDFLSFKIGMCLLMEGEKERALESLDLFDRHTPVHIFLNTAVAFHENESGRADVLLALARERIVAGDYALYEDSLIECGLLDPPALPKAEREELDAALRRPISLGTDRIYPTAAPEDPVEGAGERAAPAASRSKSGG